VGKGGGQAGWHLRVAGIKAGLERAVRAHGDLAWPLLVLLEVGFGVKQDGLDAQDR